MQHKSKAISSVKVAIYTHTHYPLLGSERYSEDIAWVLTMNPVIGQDGSQRMRAHSVHENVCHGYEVY